MTFVGHIVYLYPSLASFAPERSEDSNDPTRDTNKLCAEQKSCDYPIIRHWMSGGPHLLEDLNLPLLSLPRFPFFVFLPLPNNPSAPSPHYLNVKNRKISVKKACLASVSVRFRSKERGPHRGTRVKDFTKNGAGKRAKKGSFIFRLSFYFSRGQKCKTENPVSSVFLCSDTKRKRLLRNLCKNP